MNWQARKVLSEMGGIPRLCENLASSATQVSLCAAAAINTYVRDPKGRTLVAADEVNKLNI
jgi:hypothetical protein